MLLETRRVSKWFGGLRAVDQVDFSVDGRIDLRHHRPQRRRQDDALQRDQPRVSGDVRPGMLSGDDVTRLRAHQIARRGLARTFQTTTLFSDATGARERDDRVPPPHERRGLLDALRAQPRGWRGKSARRRQAAREAMALCRPRRGRRSARERADAGAAETAGDCAGAGGAAAAAAARRAVLRASTRIRPAG